jgi:hypothetical protein
MRSYPRVKPGTRFFCPRLKLSTRIVSGNNGFFIIRVPGGVTRVRRSELVLPQ